ncbi:hypothetical protein E3Q22_01552 [Wallemia mellicola]|nr:hypothetical protein E3Q24_04259 [Wallemia mellicola]TIB72729.1 hypothetical protein E3Q23_03271 [Wallemia mellicola]TIB79089.1 hypothetical protein E3Q21_04270 [Wallemia mellicola]TIB80963.1 hypothetical protein E3Q22_01552 [Wallemia mellicola]TIB82992.1 hypothetical protein E3Q20_04346 [Wallemia mellicola]
MTSKESDYVVGSHIAHSGKDDTEKSSQGQSEEAVFETHEGEMEFKTLHWPMAAIVMTKIQFGLGILSVPAAFASLGAVPGVIILLVMAVLTTWGSIITYEFRNNHKSTHSVPDIAMIMGGRPAKIALYSFYILYIAFVLGAQLLSISIAFNAITAHGTCTVVFTFVGLVLITIIGSFRTYRMLSWLAWAGVVSILASVMILTIAVAVGPDRPAAAPSVGPYDKEVAATHQTTFANAFLAIVNLLFAYAASPMFVTIVPEMREPKDFPKALYVCQGSITVVYIALGLVVYYYTGQYVASPALGSAGQLIKRIAYGVALPGLVAGAANICHSISKAVFVQTMRNNKNFKTNNWVFWLVWISCAAACSIFAFIIASVIPFFDSLLGLIGSVFSSFFCIWFNAIVWFWEWWPAEPNRSWIDGFKKTSKGHWIKASINIFMLLVGLLITAAGLYASGMSIKEQFDQGAVGRPFSCADTSSTS